MKFLSAGRVRACAALAFACVPWIVSAQPAGVEAKADGVLRAMTTYMAGLKQFSAQTENSLEAVTADGQKIQFVAPASVTVARPDKLRADRRGDIVDQSFFYDGKSLTLYNPGSKVYATVPAPGTIDAMLDFARTKLDVIAPGADLIDTRAFEQLIGAKSVEQAVEIQSTYAKKAYETYIAEMSKIGEMYAGLARDAYKPVETALSKKVS